MRKLRNTREGKRLMEMTEVIFDHAFNNLIKFDENGNWIKIEGNSPEWVELVTYVKNGINKAKEIIKDRTLSLNQKINNLWYDLNNLTNEQLVTLNTLVEYKINLNYFGSECCVNWYDLTDATESVSPRYNCKWGQQTKKGYQWVNYKTNPFLFW